MSFAFGQTLRRAGKRREADGVIGRARDLYAVAGRHDLRRALRPRAEGRGLHATPPGRPPVDALTPQETAVAALVAQRLSNREVAAELFVSMKTVQYHLTRIYAKLGVRSRTELAAQRAALPDA